MHKQAITMESEQAGSRSKQRVFSDLGGFDAYSQMGKLLEEVMTGP